MLLRRAPVLRIRVRARARVRRADFLGRRNGDHGRIAFALASRLIFLPPSPPPMAFMAERRTGAPLLRRELARPPPPPPFFLVTVAALVVVAAAAADALLDFFMVVPGNSLARLYIRGEYQPRVRHIGDWGAATTTTMIRCCICGDASTPPPAATDASHMQPMATDGHVSWCVDYGSFRDGCGYAGPASYTTAYASAAPIEASGGRWLRFSRVARSFDVSLVSPAAAADGSGGGEGRIGARAVSYERLLYGSDGSSRSEAGATTTTWRFADSSFALVLGFSADSSGTAGAACVVDVSAGPPAAVVRVVKPRNDAACDYVAASLGPSGPSAPAGLTSSSADSVTYEFDYAAPATTGGAAAPFPSSLPVVLPSAPTLRVDDAVFSAAVEANRTLDVSDAVSLRAALDAMVEAGALRGLRSEVDVSLSIATSVAGEARSPTVVALTPQLFFHWGAAAPQ